MKLQLIFLVFVLTSLNLISQNASSYLPTELGNVWKYKRQSLDSAGLPIGPIAYTIDSSVAYTTFLGKQTLIRLGGFEGTPMFDTSWISAEGSNIFVHQNSIDIDTFSFIFPDWFEVYRFASPLGLRYTIYQFDTTITIPTLGTLPIRVLYRGSRFGLDNVTVPAGTFTAMSFKTEITIQYKVEIPPFPPVYIDVLSLPTFYWLAENRFIVKSRQDPLYVDSLGLNIPGVLSELTEFRIPTSVLFEDVTEKDFLLYQNYPNPFNSSTTMKFRIPRSAFITLKVYDILGREVATLIDQEMHPGKYSVDFHTSNLSSGISAKGGYASGVYFYRLVAGTFVRTKKMVVQK